MPDVPTWFLLLCVGVSFGFGAGGAWFVLGGRIDALKQELYGVNGTNGHHGRLRDIEDRLKLLPEEFRDTRHFRADAMQKIVSAFEDRLDQLERRIDRNLRGTE